MFEKGFPLGDGEREEKARNRAQGCSGHDLTSKSELWGRRQQPENKENKTQDNRRRKTQGRAKA